MKTLDGFKILQGRTKPYPHDYVINRLFLWLIPEVIKPNHITIFRMIATPFVFLFILRGDWLVGIPVFVIVAFTDALDGSMARIRKQVTVWGTLFDPLADKLLVGGTLFILIVKYIDIYIGASIIVLEMAVIIGTYLKIRHGTVLSAGKWGKIKMLLQVIGVSLLMLSILLGISALHMVSSWILIASIGFALLNIFWRGQEVELGG